MHYSTILSVLLVSVVGCIAQNILNCQFSDELDIGYRCLVVDATVSEDDFVIFGGDHLESRTNFDVRAVFFGKSNLSRVPMEIFENFPNVELIYLNQCELTTINRFENCKSLKILSASSNQLSIIRPNTFAACTNLSRLFLSNNQINEFHGNGLEGLVELRLDHNRITNFSIDSFGSLKNLENLWLSRNQIALLDYELMFALSNLRELLLDFNQISIVFPYVYTLTRLRRLSLSRNRIDKINLDSFFGLDNLQELDLSGNQITELDRIPNIRYPALERIFLGGNRINRIHQDAFLGLTKLRELGLGSNQITELGKIFAHTPALERVHLEDNRIDIVQSGVFENNPELTSILLINNNIKIIEEGVFDHLKNLEKLSLANTACVNKIFIIDPPGNLTGVLPSLQRCLPPAEIRMDCTFREHDIGYTCWITDAFMVEGVPVVIGTNNHLAGRTNNDVQRVEILLSRMTHVPLEIFDTFPNLRIIDVSGSRLPRIDPLRNCRLIHTFIGSFNDLEVIPADTFTECVSLTSLTLSNNRINEFHSNGLTGVQHLNLNRNELNEITSETFGYLENLETLWLSNNQIEQIFPVMFVSMTNLRELRLINNNIRSLLPEGFNPLVNLEILLVYGNFIEEISDAAFDNLGNLRALDLGNNRLSSLGTPFSVLPRLEIVFVDHNEISHIASNLFENNRNLIEIELKNNRISIIEKGVFDNLQNLEGLNLFNNLCINENFRINPPGNLIDVLPFQQQCLPSAEVRMETLTQK